VTRRRAVAILVLVVGGIIAMSLSTILAGTEKAPALYAQVAVGNKTLDVWRDTTTHDLTLHWDDANPTVAARYIPGKFVLAELSGGKAIDVTRYPSDAAAWDEIHKLFGVRWRRVRAALTTVGAPAAAAPTADVKVDAPTTG
jgi:hypothetical protein